MLPLVRAHVVSENRPAPPAVLELQTELPMQTATPSRRGTHLTEPNKGGRRADNTIALRAEAHLERKVLIASAFADVGSFDWVSGDARCTNHIQSLDVTKM